MRGNILAQRLGEPITSLGDTILLNYGRLGGSFYYLVMTYCHCEATERHFDPAFAELELQSYKDKGPGVATRILTDVLKTEDLRGARLLDIGAGVGTIMHELFPLGIERAVLVEMASAYLTQATGEARRRGYQEHVECLHGDFTEVADKIPQVDLVTLDRVVCCYPDMERLVTTSLTKSGRWYALSYPRDLWYVRLYTAYRNWHRRRRGDPFRTFMHSERRIDDLIVNAGFSKLVDRSTWIWRVSVYVRVEAA